MPKAVLTIEKDEAQINRFRKSQHIYEAEEYAAGKEFGQSFVGEADRDAVTFLASKSEDSLLDPRSQWPFDLEDYLRDSGLQASSFAFLRGFIHGARDRSAASKI